MKTFNIDISIKDLRNKLLDYISCHAHDEVLVDIIISCINENNHSCARLYAKIAELDFPQREAVVEHTDGITIADDFVLKPFEAGVKTLPTKPKFKTSDGIEIKHELLKAMQCSDVNDLNTHVEKMKEAELVIVAGRAFAKFDNHNDGTTVIRMVEQSNSQTGKRDYLGNLIRRGDCGGYEVQLD